MSGSSRVRVGLRRQKEALLQLCVGMFTGGNKGRLKGYILHPPTVKIDWNHFAKYATLILGPMFLLLVRGYQWRFCCGCGCMHEWCRNIQKICSFFKKRKCARKIIIVFVTLSDLNKTSNRAVTHTYKMHENWSVLLQEWYDRATNAIEHFVHSNWQLW